MDMSINGGINGSDYASVIQQTQGSALENKLNNSKDKMTDVEAMAACKEFEAYMLEQVYKSMEKTVMKADEKENLYEDYFGDMMIQEYSQIAVDQGGIGLAEYLYESMKNNNQIKITGE